jgi:RNA-binding protein
VTILTPSERKLLKARAHKLDPVVLIGAKGLTQPVVAEVAAALKAHELIKVRAPAHERKERAEMFQQIASKTDSVIVQEIGKVLVLYKKWDTPTP